MSKVFALYTQAIIWAGLLTGLAITHPVAVQEPLADLRLLAWSPDGAFLLGTTPGPIVTLPGGTIQQAEIIWLLLADGSTPLQLAEGMEPRLSPDGQAVIFTRLENQRPVGVWGIDIASGQLQPSGLEPASSPGLAVAGDPAGRVFVSPEGSQRAILVNRFFRAELWLGEDDGPAQLVLSSQGELFSDLAWRPDGQALAFIRTPLGSATATAGELWRFDLATNTATPLSQNNVVDRSPVWSGDGTSLAVVRNEQWVVVPAERLLVQEFTPNDAIPTPLPPLGPAAQLTPPATIRVIHHASNTCRQVSVDQIDTYAFEEYVKRVVPYEVYPSWPSATLKAQAVAARTYAWAKYLQNPDGAYHVTDWIDNQYMCDATVTSTNQAVDDTAGEYLAYNGQVIIAMFSAENSSPTKTSPYVAYLQAVDDPVSFGQTRNGHGYGMGQWGAQRWAAWHNWSYQAILRHYYTNVTLEKGYTGSDLAPPNVSIVRPWSNFYQTSDRLHLLVNTSDDGGAIAQTKIYLSTGSETNLLVSEAGPASSSGYVIDVSAWIDQPSLAQTLVLTAAAFDGGGRRGVSPEVIIGLDRAAPTGWLTTATTFTPTTIITESPVVSLTLTASDDTAGATHIALGRYEWAWEGETLTRELVGGAPVGQVVSDPAALNGMALQATVAADPAGSWTSPAIILPAPQQYRAYFRLKVGNHALAEEVARLEVIDAQSSRLIGLHRLRGVEFRTAGVYQEFHADFDPSPLPGVPLFFRLTFLDMADIWLDRLVVVEYPIPFTNAPTYNAARFRLKIIDGAGNVSGDLLVLPSLDNSIYLPLIIK